MTDPKTQPEPQTNPEPQPEQALEQRPQEVGGKNRLDPVRYGDWEVGGRCIDF